MSTVSVPARDHDGVAQYVAYLRHVCQNPGARTALRRTVKRRPADALMLTAHCYVVGWLPRTASPHTQAVYYAVAGWVAAYSDLTTEETRPPFGRALSLLTHGPTGISEAGVQRRLIALCRASSDALLYQHMPAVLALLDSGHCSPNFISLTKDLLRWQTKPGEITRRWMTDYHRSQVAQNPTLLTGTPPFDPRNTHTEDNHTNDSGTLH